MPDIASETCMILATKIVETMSRGRGTDSLISNPRAYGDTAPAHATHKAARQTLSSRSRVEVPGVVHGYGFRRCERILAIPPAILVVGRCTHDCGRSRVVDAALEAYGGLGALRGR